MGGIKCNVISILQKNKNCASLEAKIRKPVELPFAFWIVLALYLTHPCLLALYEDQTNVFYPCNVPLKPWRPSSV
jgi:hypothetical protein